MNIFKKTALITIVLGGFSGFVMANPLEGALSDPQLAAKAEELKKVGVEIAADSENEHTLYAFPNSAKLTAKITKDVPDETCNSMHETQAKSNLAFQLYLSLTKELSDSEPGKVREGLKEEIEAAHADWKSLFDEYAAMSDAQEMEAEVEFLLDYEMAALKAQELLGEDFAVKKMKLQNVYLNSLMTEESLKLKKYFDQESGNLLVRASGKIKNGYACYPQSKEAFLKSLKGVTLASQSFMMQSKGDSELVERLSQLNFK